MDSAVAPVVVPGASSSETEEPNNEPVVSSSSTAANSSSPLLLERLRAPQQSELSRKRVVRQNLGPSSSRKKKPSCSTDPKSLTPASRVREFPNENLKVWLESCFSLLAERRLLLSVASLQITSPLQSISKVKLSWLERMAVRQILLKLW